MLTSKQRAYLRGLASKEEPLFQVGKMGINDNLIKQTDDALKARELIKLSVLETAPVSPAEAAYALAEATKAEVITTIGSKMVLFRRNAQKPQIELPKAKKK